MTDPSRESQSSLTLVHLRDLVASCDRFEAAWRAGQKPDIADFVTGAVGPFRSRLLAELIVLEIELRRERNEAPTLAEYQARFPHDWPAVAKRLADLEESLSSQTDPAHQSTRIHETPAPSDPEDTISMDPGSSDLIGGRYRLLRFHAGGGLGEVHVAEDTELKREVALKRIKARYADQPESQRRFLLEAEVTGKLEHPGLVAIYSLGRDQRSRPFYTMQFIRGEPLRQSIRKLHQKDPETRRRGDRMRNLQLRNLLRRFLAVCETIQYAHEQGVLHRDIKPANIMLGAHGETFVVDWGLTKVRDPGANSDEGAASSEAPPIVSSGSGTEDTRPGTRVGTLEYMAPEQYDGRPRNESDVFSLGATLYAIVTGRAPYSGDDTSIVQECVRACEFPRPRLVDSSVPRALEAICLKAMEKEPEDRYPTARALAEDLERWLADEPVSVYREPLHDRAGRWIRRHRNLVTGAAVLLVSTLVALVALNVLTDAARRRAEHAEDQAVIQRDRAEAARREAVLAEARAARERDRALRNYEQARELVDQIVTPLADQISALPDSDALRTALAETMVTNYRAFLEDPAADARLRRRASFTFRVAANIGRLMGEDERPGQLYDEAIGLLTRLEPIEPADERQRALILLDRGAWHLEQGRALPAEADFQAGLDLFRKLAAGNPAAVGLGGAMALMNLAGVNHHIGNHRLALRRAQDALEILQNQRGRFTPILRGMAQTALGAALRELQAPDTETALGQAIAELKKLCDNRPFDPDPAFQFALALIERSEFLANDPQRWSQARTDALAAQKLLAGLLNQHPKVPQNRRALMVAWFDLVDASLRDSNLDARALDGLARILDQAASLLDREQGPAVRSPQVRHLRGRLWTSRARLARARKQPQEAAARFQDALAEFQGVLEADPTSALDKKWIAQVQAELAR